MREELQQCRRKLMSDSEPKQELEEELELQRREKE
jgi:hypothetical protein